mmetsp:Transcript_4112/g.11219  ORF Transcript_4112/g.11219 Transcript_4112/m.11219 type:complete len:206 (+) Transcript_4112:139-756(+)
MSSPTCPVLKRRQLRPLPPPRSHGVPPSRKRKRRKRRRRTRRIPYHPRLFSLMTVGTLFRRGASKNSSHWSRNDTKTVMMMKRSKMWSFLAKRRWRFAPRFLSCVTNLTPTIIRKRCTIVTAKPSRTTFDNDWWRKWSKPPNSPRPRNLSLVGSTWPTNFNSSPNGGTTFFASSIACTRNRGICPKCNPRRGPISSTTWWHPTTT